jgi:hypothetical protein
MSEPSPRLPDFWHFTWLFWMQPITLHRLLRSLDIDFRLPPWKHHLRPAVLEWWKVRLAQQFFLISSVLLISHAVASTVGVPVDWRAAARGAFIGVVGGMLGGMLAGVAAGMMGGGIFGGVSIGLTVSAVGGVVAGMLAGVTVGVALGVAFGVTWLAMLFRLPILVIEVIVQTAARAWNAITRRSSLVWCPVLYHELSYIPHPFLESHVLAEADTDADLTRCVIEACSIAPGQRRIRRKVEAKLLARELTHLATAKDFQSISELRGQWLPGVTGADSLLLSFSDAARFLAAARSAFNPYHELSHLNEFLNKLRSIENQLRNQRTVLTQPFEEPLRALRDIGNAMHVEAQKAAASLIPKPFRAGNPLSEEEGRELFRGREDAAREIESVLADASRSASLLLLAPRRAGKTSLLKMLPQMLPDAVFVFFDLQAHPVTSVGSFWTKLAEQATIQAKRVRRVELPLLPAGPPMEAAAEWLEKLDNLPDERRVLIAIDEFERLENLFPGDQQEFLQLMGLFRATIQHRRGVRLLVSGAAPFDELDRVWDDHFISARQIKLPFLDKPTSVGLLTAPSPDFPKGTIPKEVAFDVYRRTGGQPFLLQVFGSLLVDRLNEEKRTAATLGDVQAVESRAIEWAETYFRDMYKNAPLAAREALDRISQRQPVELGPTTRRWLAQRYLLTPDDSLSIPIFAAWIQHHALV